MILSVNWADVWSMTGMGFGVVFCVLVVLVAVLYILGYSVSSMEKKTAAPAVGQPTVAPVANKTISASEQEKAAIATALYLFFKNAHDEEPDVVTIRHSHHSAWHSELNKHFNN
ncbi:MAG: OadG family protein [Prevotellaceae bacterium]|nr:OadG family protein [Candidatus Faecinaster equi]